MLLLVMTKVCKGSSKVEIKGCLSALPYTKVNGLKVYKQKHGLGLDCGCYYKYLAKQGSIMQEVLRLKKKKLFEKRKEFKENDSKWLMQNINKVIQEIARIIDYGQLCTARPTNIRCGIDVGVFDAGHIWTKGGHPEIKWNLHNIHCQNKGSNNKGSDDIYMLIGLERVYGKEYRAFVESLKDRTTIKKYFKHELKDLYKKASQIRNELKSSKKVRTPKERIVLRDSINVRLNIYNKNKVFKL